MTTPSFRLASEVIRAVFLVAVVLLGFNVFTTINTDPDGLTKVALTSGTWLAGLSALSGLLTMLAITGQVADAESDSLDATESAIWAPSVRFPWLAQVVAFAFAVLALAVAGVTG